MQPNASQPIHPSIPPNEIEPHRVSAAICRTSSPCSQHVSTREQSSELLNPSPRKMGPQKSPQWHSFSHHLSSATAVDPLEMATGLGVVKFPGVFYYTVNCFTEVWRLTAPPSTPATTRWHLLKGRRATKAHANSTYLVVVTTCLSVILLTSITTYLLSHAPFRHGNTFSCITTYNPHAGPPFDCPPTDIVFHTPRDPTKTPPRVNGEQNTPVCHPQPPRSWVSRKKENIVFSAMERSSESTIVPDVGKNASDSG